MSSRISTASIVHINSLFSSSGFTSIIHKTPFEYNARLSKHYGHNIFFKREDVQTVRSFKVRGAAAAISSLGSCDKRRGIVCASAGNHAQGVAHVSSSLSIPADIFVPLTTPTQKQQRIKHFLGSLADDKLHTIGRNFEECLQYAYAFAEKEKKVFIHPFDDPNIIHGQGTIGVDIYSSCKMLGIEPDIVIGSIGGGGMIAGVGTYLKEKYTSCKIVSTEPETCPSFEAVQIIL